MTTYHVAKTGNDANDGKTLATALLRIQTGLNKLTAGDQLEIHEGVYVEQPNFSTSGTAANPIKIYGVGTVVIDGRLDVDGLNTGLPNYGTWVEYTSTLGRKSRYTPLFHVKGSYVHVDNITVKRSMGRGLQFGTGTMIYGAKATNITIQSTRDAGLLFYYVTNGEARNITMTDTANMIQGIDTAKNHAGGLVFRSCFDFEVWNSNIYDNWGEAVMVDINYGGSARFLFDGIKVKNGAWVSFYLHAVRDVEVRNCEFWETRDWNPTDDKRIGTTQGFNIHVIEDYSYSECIKKSLPVNNTKNIYFHNNKIKNIKSIWGWKAEAWPTGLENVRIIDNEFVDDWGESLITIGASGNPINCEFRNNRIVSTHSDIIINDGMFQKWLRSGNIWKSNPGSGNLGAGDVIDPTLTESSGGTELPVAPSNLSYSEILHNKVSLFWSDNSDDEYQFNLQRSLDGTNYNLIAVLDENSTTFTDTNLTPSTKYYYRINAQSFVGQSAWSTPLAITTLVEPELPTAPKPPVNLLAENVSMSTVDLKWTDQADNEEGFIIERSRVDLSDFYEIKVTPPNTVFFRDTGLDEDTKYYYRVKAFNQNGYSAWSNTINITTDKNVVPPPPVEPPIDPPEQNVVYALDDDLNIIGIVDDYDSLIWVERYQEAGEFEMIVSPLYMSSSFLTDGAYLAIPYSSVLMEIRGRKPLINDEGEKLIISGKSIEYMLARRYVGTRTNYDGFADTLMQDLVYANLTDPSNTNRKISIFKTPNRANVFPELYAEQINFDTLYNIVTTIAKDTGLGFKVLVHGISTESPEFIFTVYKGTDRSIEQEIVPPVIFSLQYDNVEEASFFLSTENHINFVYVVSNDVKFPLLEVWGPDLEVPENEPTGKNRYEYVLETSISRELDGLPPLTDNEVYRMLLTRGHRIIREERKNGVFDGMYDINGIFKYGEDFFMGDIVSISLYGNTTTARIVELTRSFTNEEQRVFISFDYKYQLKQLEAE